MAAMRLSAQNAAQRWSQSSIWTILAQISNRGGGPLPISSGCLGFGRHFAENDQQLHFVSQITGLAQGWGKVGARFGASNFWDDTVAQWFRPAAIYALPTVVHIGIREGRLIDSSVGCSAAGMALQLF